QPRLCREAVLPGREPAVRGGGRGQHLRQPPAAADPPRRHDRGPSRRDHLGHLRRAVRPRPSRARAGGGVLVMFLYFPDNYMWSLAFLRCLNAGGHLGEMDRAGTRLREAAAVPPNGDLEAWHREWYALGEELETLADRALEL